MNKTYLEMQVEKLHKLDGRLKDIQRNCDMYRNYVLQCEADYHKVALERNWVYDYIRNYGEINDFLQERAKKIKESGNYPFNEE